MARTQVQASTPQAQVPLPTTAHATGSGRRSPTPGPLGSATATAEALAPVTAIIAPMATPRATSEPAGSISSFSERSHLHPPFVAGSLSASTAAMGACVGPALPSSSPPDRVTPSRTAPLRCSHTIIEAHCHDATVAMR